MRPHRAEDYFTHMTEVAPEGENHKPALRSIDEASPAGTQGGKTIDDLQLIFKRAERRRVL